MKKKEVYDTAFRIAVVIICSTVYSLAVTWFLEPANLVGTGLTGLGQILNRAFALINVNIPIGVFVLITNIPLCIYGAKNVSLKFVLYTMLSVAVQSFWLMGWDWLKIDFGINPNERFFLAFMGGLITGFATGAALRYGTSTGGIDIVAQAFALKKNVSIGIFSMIINILLAIIAGGIIEHAWNITLYTFVCIIVTNLVVDKVHTAYNYVRLDIISAKADELSQALLDGIHRGCTIANVKGAYTHQEKYDIFMVISSYELSKAAEIIRATDPQAFMTVSPIKRIFGNFFKHTIV